MAQSEYNLPGYGPITIRKNKANRTIRLSMGADGRALVTIPSWAPYRSGLAFAASKVGWLKKHKPAIRPLQDGQAIGKQHTLQLSPTRGISKPRTLVTKSAVIVRFPADMNAIDPTVQALAETACIRALRQEAEALLPPRLKRLAEEYDFTYSGVSIKRLKGRWGSCDQKQFIVLNLFLMQLPWPHIDYVLLHELTHTRVMQHGPLFWDAMAEVLPEVGLRRKQLRDYRPVLMGGAINSAD